jgi:hypothetical protein
VAEDEKREEKGRSKKRHRAGRRALSSGAPNFLLYCTVCTVPSCIVNNNVVTTHAAIEYCIINLLYQACPCTCNRPCHSWIHGSPRAPSPRRPPAQTAPCTMHTGFPRTRAHTIHEPLTDMSAASFFFLEPRLLQYSASSRYSHSTQLLRTCSSCPCALCPALPCLALPPASMLFG